MLGFLGGLWLSAAPFVLGYQAAGEGWTNATRNDLWVGTGLAIISVAGFVFHTLSLLKELRANGIVPDEKNPSGQPLKEPVSPPGTARESRVTEHTVGHPAAKMPEDVPRDGRPGEVLVVKNLHRADESLGWRGGGRLRSSLPVLGTVLTLVAVVLFLYARGGVKKP